MTMTLAMNQDHILFPIVDYVGLHIIKLNQRETKCDLDIQGQCHSPNALHYISQTVVHGELIFICKPYNEQLENKMFQFSRSWVNISVKTLKMACHKLFTRNRF